MIIVNSKVALFLAVYTRHIPVVQWSRNEDAFVEKLISQMPYPGVHPGGCLVQWVGDGQSSMGRTPDVCKGDLFGEVRSLTGTKMNVESPFF